MKPGVPIFVRPSVPKAVAQSIVSSLAMLAGVSVAVGGIAMLASAVGVRIPMQWCIWFDIGLSVGLVGLNALALALVLVPGATWLELSDERFVLRTKLKENVYRWADVTGFQPARILLSPCVVFDHTPEYKAVSGRRMPKAFAGHEAMIPGYFAVSCRELADLLNKFKSRAAVNPQCESV